MVNTKLILSLAAVSGVSAFVPSTLPQSTTQHSRVSTVKMGVENMVGSGAPFGVFDPLGFASKADEATLNKYRTQELKHGRVAMAAVLGWFVQLNFHPLYDGKLSSNPLKAATEVPIEGWFQIFLAINVIEYLCLKISELPGYTPGDYLGSWEWADGEKDERWDNYQTKELNNGRLAMLSIMGLFAQEALYGDSGDLLFKPYFYDK
jgi:hypothetical protein